MEKDLPLYEVVPEDGTEMTGIAIVSIPAHLKRAYVFSKQTPVRVFANKKRGIVMGVAIAADEPIYRNDKTGEYNVTFTKDAIWKMRLQWMRDGLFNDVNLEHSGRRIQATMLDSYIVDEANGFPVPEPFKDQGLKDGSWILSYKVDDAQYLADVESGKLGGFSIEAALSMMLKNFSAQKINKLDALAAVLFDKF